MSEQTKAVNEKARELTEGNLEQVTGGGPENDLAREVFVPLEVRFFNGDDIETP